MKKNMFKVMALSLAMATLSTTAAFAAGWGKVGSEWSVSYTHLPS